MVIPHEHRHSHTAGPVHVAGWDEAGPAGTGKGDAEFTASILLALPARLRPTRARDAEADADVADAAALSSYRPWVPGQQSI